MNDLVIAIATKFGYAGGPEMILPVNTGWEEEGMQGVGRVADNKNNGIVADLEDDPHLRSGTVTLSNDYPCSVTGYWTLSIPYYTSGQWKDYLSSGKVRVYRDVSGTWTEMFACEQIPVTIAAGQSVAVSLALEGLAQPPGYLRAFFHVIRLNDDVLQGGFGTDQWGGELSNPGAIDDHCNAYDEVYLTVAEVDLRVGGTTSPPAMPDVYEDTLPYVVPMNRDYDQGRLDGQGQPLPDCDPNATVLYNDHADDELVPGYVVLPWSSNATWTMVVPPELRVWRWDSALYTWWLVESGVSYSASVSGHSFNILVEGLAPSGVPPYLTVSCQKTDGEGLPLGLPVTDRVKVEVVSIDLEIAGISELDEETQPAFVPLNDDYDEGNRILYSPRWQLVTDNNRLNGQIISYPPGIVPDDDDLTEATLTIDGPNGQTGKYWIEVVNEPAWLEYGVWPGYSQYIKVWKADGTAVPRTRETALLVTLDAQAVDLLIEGLAEYYSQQTPIRLIAHFEPDGDYAKAGVKAEVTDEALAQVAEANLTAYRPQHDSAGNYAPFARTEVAEEDEEKSDLGPGIRINGDDDNENEIADRFESATNN